MAKRARRLPAKVIRHGDPGQGYESRPAPRRLAGECVVAAHPVSLRWCEKHSTQGYRVRGDDASTGESPSAGRDS